MAKWEPAGDKSWVPVVQLGGRLLLVLLAGEHSAAFDKTWLHGVRARWPAARARPWQRCALLVRVCNIYAQACLCKQQWLLRQLPGRAVIPCAWG